MREAGLLPQEWFFSAGRVTVHSGTPAVCLLSGAETDMLGIRRIHEKESAVVCPVIDVIDWNTFEYLGNPGEPQIGGFDWRLVFTWHVVPQRERALMRSPIDVIRSGPKRAHPGGKGSGIGWLWTSVPYLTVSPEH